MPVVIFNPGSKKIDVKSGTELLDAARKAAVEIELPCGGKGTCGKCIVRVISGNVKFDMVGVLPRSMVAEGFVLACKTKIMDTSVVVEVPEQIGRFDGRFADNHDDILLVRQELLPKKWNYDPLAYKWTLDVPDPRMGDGLSDLDRLTRTIQKDWGKCEIFYPLNILKLIPKMLRVDNGKVTVTILREGDKYRVVGIEPGNQTTRNFGIAVDIGTTTIAVQLVFLPTAKIIATKSDYNKQIDCGLDVISRINYARKPERLLELKEKVLKTINNLIGKLANENEVKTGEICNAVIAGNTTMIHLLLGIIPEYIRLEPYTPAVLNVPYLTAIDIGIDINPYSWVYISPSVGSYVGGDITSGILCTNLATDTDEINLFIDIGTNGEIVIGNNDFLMTCACSAGPAFEGGGIEDGMRAAAGAIEDVNIDKKTGVASYSTIGNIKPKGICGSGMITLIANLFQTGWLDAAGKLNRVLPSPAISFKGRHAIYTLVQAENSGTGKPIIISEQDIENIIRAKAAIYSSCSVMLDEIGITFMDVANVYIAGGFGRFLDLEKAKIIGLIPDIPPGKFKYIGNSSLMGAYMVLVSQDFQRKQIEIAKKMTYIDLGTNPGYMDQYIAAMFLPHTDLSKFPIVKF